MDLNTTDNSILIDIIKKQNLTITSLRKTIEELSTDSKILREQIEYLTKKLFGTKSEKTAALTGQIILEGMECGQFDEAEVEANPDETDELIKPKQ